MYDFIVYEEDAFAYEGIEIPENYEADPNPSMLAYEDFRELLNVCFRHATSFSMSKVWWDSCTDTSLEEELAPFLDREIKTLVWFGYDFRNPPEGCYGDVHAMIYRAEPAAKVILLRYFDDIFLRKFSKGNSSYDLELTLEDLCFFHQTKLFLGTVSHEKMLSVEPIHKELEDFMKTHGKWKLRPPTAPQMLMVDLERDQAALGPS